MKWVKRIIGYGFIGFLLLGISITASYFHIIAISKHYLFDDISKIPENKVGIVLGTSKYSISGGINPYFKYRMQAAADLYKSGKIKHVLVSGDNHLKGYNEPKQMKEYLVNLGVKSKDVSLDYAGFRTFDSMIRGKEVFGQTSFTIISQKFHNERAVFIAREKGIDAVAFNAKSPKFSNKMKVREILAKFKAILDVYFLPTKPKFLGEKIEIES